MGKHSVDPAQSVLWMIRGQWVSLAVRAATQLGLPDALDEPRTLDDLAASLGADAPTLERLLRVLEGLGLVGRVGERYTATPLGDTLRADHPSGMRSLALMQSEPASLAAWGSLADAVRSGGAVFESVNGVSMWDFIAADPERAAQFNAAMARRGAAQADAIRSGGDLADVQTIVDVGGGKGGMLIALLAKEPRLNAVVADLGHVAADADKAFAAAGLSDRARGVATDFFQSVPTGGDAYVLSNVLHDWPDDDCVRILRNVRAAMSPRGRLWIVEMVLGSPGRTPHEEHDLHLVDLHMLVMFGARERTAAEYGGLLERAGFDHGRMLSGTAAWDVIEARPA
jgi:DNA-binding HxlR family transcriptional regulator